MWSPSIVFVLLMCICHQCTQGISGHQINDKSKRPPLQRFSHQVDSEPTKTKLHTPSDPRKPEAHIRPLAWIKVDDSKTKLHKPSKSKAHIKPLAWVNRVREGSDVINEEESFITRGDAAYEGLAPYQVSLQMRWGGAWHHICGASLVQENKVVTAGHCMTDWGPDPTKGKRVFRVGLGWHDLQDPGEKHRQTIRVIRTDMHPEYNDAYIGWYKMNDIAVLTLKRNATLNTKVDVISMGDADDDSTWAGYDCLLTGWGKTEWGNPAVLRRTMLMAMTKANCKSMWNVIDVKIHEDHEMCAVDYYDRSAACSGDSGGPLICNNRLAGVVSWGLSSCNGCFPSVFTRVFGYRQWVEDMMSGNYSQTSQATP